MKKLLPILFLSLAFVSCSKEDVALPTPQDLPVTVKETEAFYKDPFISIKEIKATQTASGQVTLNFSTEYEKNLKSIEVYSGASSALLCEIYKQATSGTTAQLKKYSVIEKDIQVPVNYYMIKYTTINNEWSVSPLYKVELK